jgi:hypothetical protein
MDKNIDKWNHRYLNPISRISGMQSYPICIACALARKIHSKLMSQHNFQLKIVILSFDKYFDLSIIGYGIK